MEAGANPMADETIKAQIAAVNEVMIKLYRLQKLLAWMQRSSKERVDPLHREKDKFVVVTSFRSTQFFLLESTMT